MYLLPEPACPPPAAPPAYLPESSCVYIQPVLFDASSATACLQYPCGQWPAATATKTNVMCPCLQNTTAAYRAGYGLQADYGLRQLRGTKLKTAYP